VLQAWLKSTKRAKSSASSSASSSSSSSSSSSTGATDENLLLGFPCFWVFIFGFTISFVRVHFISADTNISRISWSFWHGHHQHTA
jgi:hypothetical protein